MTSPRAKIQRVEAALTGTGMIDNGINQGGALPTLGPIPHAARALGIEPHDYRVWIRTFGRLRVYIDYHEVPPSAWPYPKVQSLLRFLLMREGFVAVEEVFEAIWPNITPARARQNFSVALHHLRRLLEPHKRKHHDSRLLVYHDQQVRINHSMILVDRVLFQRLAREAEAVGPQHERYCEYLERMVALYAGPLYEDEPYQDWCVRERERLEQTYLMARGELARDALNSGNFMACIHHCEEALDRDPLNEPFHLLLMQAHRGMGHRARALAHYHDLR
ncbi:MAG TPA: BTAD domain-containing putative transcriptional regulator [Bacillota bacterium]